MWAGVTGSRSLHNNGEHIWWLSHVGEDEDVPIND